MTVSRDTFFSQNHCDRCGATPLAVRTMSWYTTEVICPTCSGAEKRLREARRAAGLPEDEGCGFVPPWPEGLASAEAPDRP